MTNKLPSVLKQPPMLVKNAQVPPGQVSFQVLGDNDSVVFTVVVPKTKKPFDLTHYAPLHNLVMSSALKKLLDDKNLILLNAPEIDGWIKDKCPTDGGNGGTCPTPELKDQKPLTFDMLAADATAITGKGEPSAIVAITVGTDSYYGVITGAGTFSIPATGLESGTYSAKAMKQGYKDTTGTLTVSALNPSADLEVDHFVVREAITGTAQPGATIKVATIMGSAETVADGSGAFSVSSSALYFHDVNYEVTVTATLAGHETKTATATASRIPAPAVTAREPVTYGDTNILISTAPNVRVKYRTDVQESDAQGNAAWLAVTPVEAAVAITIGSEPDSIYLEGTHTFIPVKRQAVFIAGKVKQSDTSVTVRVFGTTADLPPMSAILTVGSDEHSAVTADGKVTFTSLDLTGQTSIKVSTNSTRYVADDLQIEVETDSAELQDQEQLTVQNVLADAADVTGTGEPGAYVMFKIGSTLYYTQIEGDGTYTVPVKDLTEGTVTITALKTGYKDSTATLTIGGLSESDPLTVAPFQIRSVMQGTAHPNALITLVLPGATVPVGAAGADGKWTYDTKSLYVKDQDFDIEVRAELTTYVTRTLTVRGTKIPAPTIAFADPVYFGDTTVAVKSEPFARIKHGDVTTESRPDGAVLFLEQAPIKNALVFEIGIDTDSVYDSGSTTLTPNKWETYLIPNQAKQSDTQITVRVLSLTTGLPLPKGELSFNGDKFEATADANGILTFTGLDLTEKTQAEVKLISDLYVAAPATVRILTEEEAGNKKTQKPLTAEQVFADDQNLTGTGEPNAILEIAIQGRTYYTRVGADDNWSITLAGTYSEPMTYSVSAYKQGYHDASGQLKVNALNVLETLTVNDFTIGQPVTGSAEPNAVITLNVAGYPASNERTVHANASGEWTHETETLYSKDLTGALIAIQKADHAETQTVQKQPAAKKAFNAITLDRPVTYGDQYFIIQAEPEARISYNGETKICDADGQVLFRPLYLTDAIHATIGSEGSSRYITYTATLEPQKIVMYFTTQTILRSQTSITFNVYGARIQDENYNAELSGTGVAESKTFSGNTVTFDGLDLTNTDHVIVKMVKDQYSDVEYRFAVTDGTIVPPDEDPAPVI